METQTKIIKQSISDNTMSWLQKIIQFIKNIKISFLK